MSLIGGKKMVSIILKPRYTCTNENYRKNIDLKSCNFFTWEIKVIDPIWKLGDVEIAKSREMVV